MTDEIAERVLAQDLEKAEAAVRLLEKRRAVCIEQLNRLQDERGRVALAVFTDNEKASVRLNHLNAELATQETTLASFNAALKAAGDLVVAAQQATGRADALVHIKRVNELLAALVECAPRLDACWGTVVPGQAGGFRHDLGPKNPGLYVKTGAIVAELVGALKALGLDRGVSWPPRRFELMHIDDFRIELEKLVQAFQHGRLVRTRNFVHLIGDWSSSVRAALARHGEQTNQAA
jgi:hypothetical protein